MPPDCLPAFVNFFRITPYSSVLNTFVPQITKSYENMFRASILQKTRNLQEPIFHVGSYNSPTYLLEPDKLC
jgi:hypothetical protein